MELTDSQDAPLASTESEVIRALLTKPHPLYSKRKADWERDERRYQGGSAVWQDLQPFQWEEVSPQLDLNGLGEEAAQEALERAGAVRTSTHFQKRQEQATYINFARRVATKFVGRLASEAPTPGEGVMLGELGEIAKAGEARDMSVPANQFYYDCDRKGSSFVAWSNDVQGWSKATGHRWVGVRTPPAPKRADGRGPTKADEIAGFRPYLIHLSPLDVPNWQAGPGGLDFCVIRESERVLVKDGQYFGGHETRLFLWVRQGFTELGPAFQRGGWWKYDKDGKAIRLAGQHVSGDLGTSGAIPLRPYFYEQDERQMSRAGTSELGAIAVSYMNISSAGDNDAIEAGGRALYLLNITQEAHNLTVAVAGSGSRHVPVQGSEDHGPVSIYDTGSVTASTAIESSLRRKMEEAAKIAQDELNTAPTSSGAARAIEFMDVEVPRLALMAYNRESAENDMARWFAELLDKDPSGVRIEWKKKFDLDTTAQDWLDLLDASYKANVNSPTLTGRALEGIAKEKGLPIDGPTWKTIQSEIDEGSARQTQATDVDETDEPPVFA